MRTQILAIALAGGLAATLLPSQAQACSIRGNYCGYPSWAANAFEGRFGFKGDPRLLTDYYPGFSNRKAYVAGPKPHKQRR